MEKNNLYEEIFDEHRLKYSNLLNLFINKGKCEGKNVIDIGCGTGRYTIPFSELNCALLVGLDKSREMLKTSITKKFNINYLQGTVENLPIKNEKFDCIVLSQVFQWINNKERALLEINRILKKDGVFLLNTLSHKQLGELILMKYFPEILEIELKRFPDINEIREMLINSNCNKIEIMNVEEKRQYTISELVKFAEDKATSALRILENNIGNTKFRQKVGIYRENLLNTYNNNPIIENHNYTLIISQKE